LSLNATCFPKDFVLKAYNQNVSVMEMRLTSTAFRSGDPIPDMYSCDGANISPPLHWDDVPEGTKSLALICEDPDAPVGVFSHWVYYNIPPSINMLPEDVLPMRYPDIGGEQGTNDFNKIGYGGPCPPEDTHRYFFKIYALDTVLKIDSGARKERIEQAIKGHVLAKGELIGVYARQQYRKAA
jgi:Raf kinase inhibitor-like YbhB/YbcL family protein